MSALPKRWFTPEEYLELEGPAPYKSQYIAGEIFAMAGVQAWHDKVVFNLILALGSRLRGRSCTAFTSDVRVEVEGGEMYSYPDLSALCGQPRFSAKGNPPSLLNPQVIFEVLSPSTESFVRGDKFRRYRCLESLTDYVLVSSEQMRVEHYRVQANGTWACEEHDRPDHVLTLAGIGCEVPLAEIYEAVAFPDPFRR